MMLTLKKFDQVILVFYSFEGTNSVANIAQVQVTENLDIFYERKFLICGIIVCM